MLSLLNNNIIEYVLNLYLDYQEDITKIKQLYKYKFNFFKHFGILKEYHNNGKLKRFLAYLDNKKIKYKEWYINGIKLLERNFKNEKFNGLIKVWDIDNNLIIENLYKDNELIDKKFFKQ
jgi:antitoxin component YwqK of YwqJK toxin-antitoxin module